MPRGRISTYITCFRGLGACPTSRRSTSFEVGPRKNGDRHRALGFLDVLAFHWHGASPRFSLVSHFEFLIWTYRRADSLRKRFEYCVQRCAGPHCALNARFLGEIVSADVGRLSLYFIQLGNNKRLVVR